MLAAMPGNGKACLQSYRLLVAPVRMTELEPRRVVAVGVALYASIFSFVNSLSLAPLSRLDARAQGKHQVLAALGSCAASND
jgi:hypothetical protein